MLVKSWWKYQFCVWPMTYEPRCRKLQRISIGCLRLRGIFAASSRASLVFHATASSTIGTGFPAATTGFKTLGGVQYRPVSGATTQISIKSFFHSMFRWFRVITYKGIETLPAHDVRRQVLDIRQRDHTITIPGVQKPHWLPLPMAIRCWTAWGFFTSPMPSTVITCFPSTLMTGARQAFTDA